MTASLKASERRGQRRGTDENAARIDDSDGVKSS